MNSISRMIVPFLSLAGSLRLAGAVGADALVAGNLRVDPPTLHCLGFVWDFEKDAKRRFPEMAVARIGNVEKPVAALPAPAQQQTGKKP